jgi:hypothetical protein
MRYVDDTLRGLRIKAEGERPEILLKRFKQSAFGV